MALWGVDPRTSLWLAEHDPRLLWTIVEEVSDAGRARKR